ncbi:hypothetical protein FA95DRAFT_1554182 [Auriscalpium vulgare]|uniref:Uncharacterized protein n=1 Tax=Auriscalpium vulgare TaxID=40419 RepID=A0ACB8S5C8_9AGAM|nr:hypothetical protein FA95DRAFT_1554182 [Auriscalpium vulgare]
MSQHIFRGRWQEALVDIFWSSIVPATAFSVVAALVFLRLLTSSRAPSKNMGSGAVEMQFAFDERDQGFVTQKLEERQVVVSKLIVHPIKSCRGTSLAQADYNPSGLELDRRWSVIDANKHNILTARAFPKMVLIHPKIIEDPTDPSGGRLEIHFPPDSGCETFSVPLKPTASVLQQWSLVEDLTVHSFTSIDGYITQAYPTNADPTICSTILSRFFNRPVHLVYKGPRRRPAPPTHSFPQLEANVDYHDAFPLLFASEESFESVKNIVKKWCDEQENEDLRKWDASKMVIERYRPNVVLKGAGLPFAEDMWKELTISPAGASEVGGGKGFFTLVSKCTRCMLPNIDPADGSRNMSIPSKPLLKYRRGLDPGRMALSCFGCNGVPAQQGTLHVGDIVSVRTWDHV